MMGAFNGEMKRLEKEQKVSKSSTGVVTPIVSNFGDPYSIQRIQKYNAALLDAAKTQVKLGTITKAEFDKGANQIKMLYDSFVDAGFTNEQAFGIITAILPAMLNPAQAPSVDRLLRVFL